MSVTANYLQKLPFSVSVKISKDGEPEYCKNWRGLILNLKEEIACDHATD